MRRQFVKTVSAILRENPKTVLLIGDVGTFAFRDAFKEFPDRVFNVGILEQSMVGMAAGWALRGYIPIVHTISPFIAERAYEQLKIDFGYQNLKGIFIGVGGSHDYSGFGPTHHCPADVSIIRNIPGFQVRIPGTPYEVDAAIRCALHSATVGSTYIRLAERSNTIEHDQGVTNHTIFNGPSVLAVGPCFDMVLDACARLPVSLYYVNVLPPIFGSDFNPTSHYVVVEPYYASRLAQDLSSFCWPVPVAVKSFSLPIMFPPVYGSPQDIDEALGFTHENLRKVILQCLEQ
jgi:transketolase